MAGGAIIVTFILSTAGLPDPDRLRDHARLSHLLKDGKFLSLLLNIHLPPETWELNRSAKT